MKTGCLVLVLAIHWRGATSIERSRALNLVHRLLNPLGSVAFKMGRLRGGRKEHIWIDT